MPDLAGAADCRHKTNYADVRIMPTNGSEAPCWWADRRIEVGIIRRLNRGVAIGYSSDLHNGRRLKRRQDGASWVPGATLLACDALVSRPQDR